MNAFGVDHEVIKNLAAGLNVQSSKNGVGVNAKQLARKAPTPGKTFRLVRRWDLAINGNRPM